MAISENVRRLGLYRRVGDCYDNAPMESFWGSMRIELYNRQRWSTVAEGSADMGGRIEDHLSALKRQRQ